MKNVEHDNSNSEPSLRPSYYAREGARKVLSGAGFVVKFPLKIAKLPLEVAHMARGKVMNFLDSRKTQTPADDSELHQK